MLKEYIWNSIDMLKKNYSDLLDFLDYEPEGTKDWLGALAQLDEVKQRIKELEKQNSVEDTEN